MIEEREDQVEVDGGVLPVSIFSAIEPQGPAVIVLGEIWAVNGQIRGLCRRLAATGIPVIAPDLYRGRDIPAADAGQDVLNVAFDSFPDLRAIRDTRALARYVRDGRLGLPPQRPRVWGFCMGGRFAHYLAAVTSDVSAVINFYGRVNFPRSAVKPFTPLDVTGLIDMPYLGVFAEHDALIPLADVQELSRQLRARPVAHDIRVFEGAHHGFMNETRAAHDPSVAAAAWELALTFLRDHQA